MPSSPVALLKPRDCKYFNTLVSLTKLNEQLLGKTPLLELKLLTKLQPNLFTHLGSFSTN